MNNQASKQTGVSAFTSATVHQLFACIILFASGMAQGQGVSETLQSPTLGCEYSTSGHPKAKGLVVTIKYPAGWRRAEGERPNIVQKFSEQRSDGFTRMAGLLVRNLPEEFAQISEAELYAELSSMQNPAQEFREMFPPDARIISVRVTKYDGAPGLLCEYVMQTERVGLRFEMHSIRHVVFHKGKLLALECSVGGRAGSPEISSLFEESRALFTMMGVNIVFMDKWTASPEIPTSSHAPSSFPSSLPYNDPPSLILTLVVNFIITWGLGLTPPLVVRYAIARRPLSPKTASWIAAVFSVFFWIVFLEINTTYGERPGRGVVWIIMFFVARWIMSRGYAPPSVSRANSGGQFQKQN